MQTPRAPRLQQYRYPTLPYPTSVPERFVRYNRKSPGEKKSVSSVRGPPHLLFSKFQHPRGRFPLPVCSDNTSTLFPSIFGIAPNEAGERESCRKSHTDDKYYRTVSSYSSSTNTKTKCLTRRAIHHLAGAALDLSVDAAGALAEEAVAAALVALLTAARDVRDAVCPPAGLLLFYARHVKEGGQGEGAP